MVRSVILWCLVGLALLTAAALFLHQVPTTQRRQVDISKIMAATSTYRQQLEHAGVALPSEVPVDQLIARGLLSSNEVSAFAGMNVTVTLAVEKNNPQQVLMRVRLPNGQELVTLNDGSVQQLKH
jgi:hypothetical protein